MVVEDHRDGPRLALHKGPRVNSCRPAVDTLFESIANLYGPAALAVILTGMGRDGAQGCQHIRDAGGGVIVQDEATSVVWGMPSAVVDRGLAEAVLPLNEIAPIVTRKAHALRRRVPTENCLTGDRGDSEGNHASS